MMKTHRKALKCPYWGKAILIKELGYPNWYPGTKLYKVIPSVDVYHYGMLKETSFVIVAYTPRAVDHGRAETTVFAAAEHENDARAGKVFDDLPLDSPMVELLEPRQRVVGRHDPEAALKRLQGGYQIVDSINGEGSLSGYELAISALQGQS
jgi:hypothetical protein